MGFESAGNRKELPKLGTGMRGRIRRSLLTALRDLFPGPFRKRGNPRRRAISRCASGARSRPTSDALGFRLSPGGFTPAKRRGRDSRRETWIRRIRLGVSCKLRWPAFRRGFAAKSPIMESRFPKPRNLMKWIRAASNERIFRLPSGNERRGPNRILFAAIASGLPRLRIRLRSRRRTGTASTWP